METLQVKEIQPHHAIQRLAGCERFDPRGTATGDDLADIAWGGQCFEATTEKAKAVYVVQVKNGNAWISACKGSGPVKWREVLLPIIEAQATGCNSVGFQTKRKSLVNAAQEQGYEITGWIMKKKLK